jgi:hypothetical protein
MPPEPDAVVTPTRPTTSDDELLLSIGAVVGAVSLLGAPQPFVAQLRARYEAFLMPPSPGVARAFSVTLRFDAAPPGKLAGRVSETGARPLAVTAGERAMEITRWDFEVRLDAQGGRARAAWSGAGRCEMNPFAVDSLMRVLWSIFLSRDGGALVHACGLRHAEIGVVFPGQSGAGKTTLARKAPDADDVLSDEMVALRPSDEGWRVYGTPFWGDFARGGISMRSWPLRALGFLSQREGVVMAPITSSEATLRLLSCFVCFQTDRPTVERNLAIAARLCSEVRSVEAQLTRGATTAEIFRKLSPHLGPEITRKVPPHSTREMISEFRSFLRKHKTYAFKPRGSSMRPFLKSGDSLFIQAAGESDLAAGDVLLYWTPGRTPDEDALTCHRLVARVPAGRGRAARYLTKGDSLSHIERFENGRTSEILGKVSAISRDGRTWKVPGRAGNLARLFGSLVAMPILRMAGR